jgi:phosphoribosylformimino-5-aminoimidazole carboxamide ribotide isomerase
MALQLYPAVDILGGKAVRLQQGDFARKTEYDTDPLDAARRWIDAGARRLHVVDLDGARSSEPVNLDALERIVGLGVAVQYGGGLRQLEHAERALELGAERIVLGTAAFLNDRLLTDLVVAHRQQLAVGIDVRGGRVAIQGWQERLKLTPEQAVVQLVERGVETIIYTKVDWDGTMQGADLKVAMQLIEASKGARVIYSGGIGSLDDLRRLAALDLEGVIVGKALYEGRFSVEEALEVL